jgi:hypothetical protein
MQAIREGLFSILEEDRPMTVRQVFYQATTRGLVEKTEAQYKGTVVRLLTELRRAKVIPYGWVTDSTRWQRKPQTFGSMAEALRVTADCYRRALWTETPAHIEIWLEKEALAGVLYEETAPYDVPLMVTKGYPSLTYLQAAAESFEADGRPVFLYYFGDHDPSGEDISRVVERDIRAMAPSVEIHFERVAVNPYQIALFHLPTRPTKATDSRARAFAGDSVEVDAFPPKTLRALCRACIEGHLDPGAVASLRKTEELERETLRAFAVNVASGLQASGGGP